MSLDYMIYLSLANSLNSQDLEEQSLTQRHAALNLLIFVYLAHSLVDQFLLVKNPISFADFELFRCSNESLCLKWS